MGVGGDKNSIAFGGSREVLGSAEAEPVVERKEGSAVRRTMSFLALALAVLWPGAGNAEQQKSPAMPDTAAASAMDLIRPEAMRAHIRFLADDLLEGRGPGTTGYRIAANYVAAHFEALGLESAGADGTYFQPVPLRKVDLEQGKSSMSLTQNGRTRTLTYAVDYQLDGWQANNFENAEKRVAAPVVFAGYGVTAPEFGHDDYANVDVRGKLVAMFYFSAPSSFPPEQRAYYASNDVKARTAADNGAVGILAFFTPQDAERWPWDWSIPQMKMGSLCFLDPNGEPQSLSGVFPEIRARVFLSQSGAEALFAGAPHSLEEVFAAEQRGESLSFDLPIEASVETVTRHRAMSSANVVAMLPGSNPELKNEYVVFTAHLDHLGVGEPVDGDAIYNGAYDNASGAAGLIEVARAFASLPNPPHRSLVFAAVTGEEMGLIGADYFARYPTVSRARIVASINIDGLAILFQPSDVVAYGGEHSSLGKAMVEAASRLEFTVSPDPMPEEAFFIRQDAYPFVLQGIPAIWVDSGTKTVDPDVDGQAIVKEWLQTRYHTPKDDFDQPIDFDAAAQHARLFYLIGLEVATMPERPAWNPGDFFGEKFGHQSRK
jgi:hypothetical protein